MGSPDDSARLLVLDDEPDIRLGLSVLLESRGYQVSCAATGMDAVHLARARAFDVVLLDIRLPDIDGLEVLSRIREHDPDQVALMMTAYPSVDTAVQAFKDGATDYVRKPMDNREVLCAVRKAVDLARERRLQRRQEQELRELSSIDPVSSLYNRHHFDVALEHEVRRAERQRHSLSLVMLDLDSFKPFNDTFGHVEGDGLLGAVGAAISEQIRAQIDVACRYGGDEFAVVLVDADTVRARGVADRIRLAIHRRSRGRVTASVGVACHADGMKGEDLVRAADAALYRAKEAGGDRVYVAPSP